MFRCKIPGPIDFGGLFLAQEGDKTPTFYEAKVFQNPLEVKQRPFKRLSYPRSVDEKNPY